MRLVSDAKNERVQLLLQQTEDFLRKLGARVDEEKDLTERATRVRDPLRSERERSF
jgi:hypothetical protein